tara:strand:- start:10595 stop:11137 length:543 start_codon:yes stop_codon:yes gene_type:complete
MIEKVKINKVFSNPVNPRLIKENKFIKLKKSIKEFPEMLKLRPIVVNNEMGILGGNMRYKACVELGLKDVWIIKVKDLTDKQMEEFVIKDNVGFGEWDWDILANQFDNKELTDWGLDVWQTNDETNLDDFFNEEIKLEEKENTKIVLEYNKEDYETVVNILNKEKGSKEEIIKNLLLNNK